MKIANCKLKQASAALLAGVAILHLAMIAHAARAQGPSSAPIVTLAPAGPTNMATVSPPTPPGPLARLVRNPRTAEGLPPFALADQLGMIQRYVEPVPHVDLDSYVGSVVAVRHDTGQTLLATQLELPPLPDGGAAHNAHADFTKPATLARQSAVRGARFVDDEMPVELLSEREPELALPPAGDASPWDEELPLGNGSAPAESFADYGGAGEYLDAAAACPECKCSTCGLPDDQPFAPPWRERRTVIAATSSPPCRLFANVELAFMRLHLLEGAVGKLSEKYELSPRIIVGFEGPLLADGRVRYWNYGRTTPILGGPFTGGGVRFDMDVLDFEATRRFQGRSSDVVLGLGLRLAKVEITDPWNYAIANDLVGMTFAADARTHLFPIHDGKLNWAYGGRFSILGGDWGGDAGSLFLTPPLRDDNVVVHELYAGVEYRWRHEQVDLFARAAFEMQNWHSDALAQYAGADSIGFIGPSIQLGARY